MKINCVDLIVQFEIYKMFPTFLKFVSIMPHFQPHLIMIGFASPDRSLAAKLNLTRNVHI